MKCMDCKIRMDKIERSGDGDCLDGRITRRVYIVYKCPRCFVEIEEGDDDYDLEE